MCLSAVTTHGIEFLDLRPCCLHIFAAVAANIWNTVSWQHSQDCVYFNCFVGGKTITHWAKHMLWALVHRCGNIISLETRPGYPNFEHEYATVSFGACVSVKQWPRTGRACGPSALLFAHLCSCVHKHETRFHASSLCSGLHGFMGSYYGSCGASVGAIL